MRDRPFLILAAVILFVAPACKHIELTPDIAGGGILEDAILVASPNGAAPRQAYKLGDVDLSAGPVTFSHNVPAASTHWWLIGHMGGNVVYCSNASLANISIWAVEPYNMPGASAWNIPANLDAYVNGGTYSFDWWAQTINNFSSNVAPDTNTASAWQFAPNGTSIGTIAVALRK